MRFATKFPLVTLDKSQVTLVASNNHSWMERKVNKIHVHSLTQYLHIVTCNQFATNFVNVVFLSYVAMCHQFIRFLTLLFYL
jgi:hypothetical protein